MLELFALAIQLITAVLLLGFLPGFALSLWLFADRSIDVLERIFVSVITSLVISGLTAYLLVVSGLGVSPAGLVMGLGSITIIFVAGAASSHPWQGVYQRMATDHFAGLRSTVRNRLPVTILSAAAAVLLMMGAAYSFRMDQNLNNLAFTEFYVQPSSLAEDGVILTIRDGSFDLPVSIANHEGYEQVYHIESVASSNLTTASMQPSMVIPIGNEAAALNEGITVLDSDTWSGTVSVYLPDTSVDFVEIYLFYSDSNQVAANLRIWLPDSELGEELR